MDYSDKLSHNQLSKFLDICLEFYKDGEYSTESIDAGNCSATKRKSMKHDFKEFFVGTKAKPKQLNPKIICVIEALLEADTSKVIELKRKLKHKNKFIKELEEGKEAAIKYEINQRTRKLESEVRQQIQSEMTDKSMRDTNRMLRYQDIMDKQAITINHYKENYVARELHDENLNNYLELKEQYELAHARLKEYEKGDNKELQKQLDKEEKEKAKKKAEIEKKRKELEELEASI
jgi:hypothetical protein